VIEQSFNMNPVPIVIELWEIFCKFKLCKTPSEELHYRFKFAKVVDVPKTPFALPVSWMLRSLLVSSHATKDMTLAFVHRKALEINAGFFADI
jgi:hypothetical protein